MLRERVAISLLLLPLIGWVIGEGGWLFRAGIILVLLLAVIEYGLMFRRAGHRPALPLLVVAVVVIPTGRQLWTPAVDVGVLSAVVLLAMAWHAIDYERGAETPGTDFALTTAGAIYIGWIGSFLVSLRSMPDGLWWFMIALPAIWVADSAAFLVGHWIGRHRLSPRLSPKKSVEGYLAGIPGGALAGWGLSQLWSVALAPGSSLTPIAGLITGGMIAALAPMGDLGISMLKRELKIKDTGTLLPGHGGALDRLDSWLWAGVLGYYLAQVFSS
jgi:phosphatidate cytidylyltransferase